MRGEELVERVRVRLIEGACEGMGDYEAQVARSVAMPDHWKAEAETVVAMVRADVFAELSRALGQGGDPSPSLHEGGDQ